MHALALAATWSFGSSAAFTDAPTIAAVSREQEPEPAAARGFAVVPFERHASVVLDAVHWTAPRRESSRQLALRFGLTADELHALAPELDAGVEPGQRVLVYRNDPDAPSRSIGAPNRGRIQHAAAFPEGDGWVLRGYRPRTWATRGTVSALAGALGEWRERFPEAQPVLLGEFSRRAGGRVRPHKSHCSGRDVDVGYVLRSAPAAHRFTVATFDTLDAAATWGLVERLVASGEVESIFMAAQVQRQLLPYAMGRVEPSRLPAIFSVLAPDARAQKKALLRAWGGHDDHIHVRFACGAGDPECGDAVRRSTKKRRKGRKRR